MREVFYEQNIINLRLKLNNNKINNMNFLNFDWLS